MMLSSPFLACFLVFGASNTHKKWPPLCLSLIGCLCIQGSILFPSEVEKGGEVPGLASEIIIVSIPPPSPLRTSSSWLLLAVSSSWKSCIMSAPLCQGLCRWSPWAACPTRLHWSRSNPPPSTLLFPHTGKTLIILTQQLMIACDSTHSSAVFMI